MTENEDRTRLSPLRRPARSAVVVKEPTNDHV
jgi:hypothetical protein